MRRGVVTGVVAREVLPEDCIILEDAGVKYHIEITDEDDDPRQLDTCVISGRIVYPDVNVRGDTEGWMVQVFIPPESWATWEPEAVGDNTRAHVEGDRVRVQFLLDDSRYQGLLPITRRKGYGYYVWSCGTITECADTAYTVRFDDSRYAGHIGKVRSERVHPVTAPAAGSSALRPGAHCSS